MNEAQLILKTLAGAEVARFYRVPSASWICSDSLGYDAQNAMEKTLAALTHAQARVSAVWGVGSFESEKTISPIQALIDDEIVRMVRKYLTGIPVNEETIALDEIRRVGITGEFMSSPHTYQYFRGSIFEPRLGIRLHRSNASERDTLIARAEDRVEAILTTPRPPTMDEETRNELLKIESRYSRT